MMFRSLALVAVIVGGLTIAGCGGSGTSQSGSSSGASQPAPASGTAMKADAPTGPEPKNVAEVFPAGPGRDLVMNNCTSCHNVACSAIGQRTPDRWDSLRDAHRERVTGADVDAIFTYLKTNFGPDKPEPKIPPAFLEGGCTPF
jgi:mono/diheme cytochrome c family protein